MTHRIIFIEQLEKLINDREYFDNLTICAKINVNGYLQSLTNLTELFLQSVVEKFVDFPELPNLKCLKFGYCYERPMNLERLTNLTHLKFEGGSYNHPLNLTTLTNLEYICFPYAYKKTIDFSTLSKLTFLGVFNNIPLNFNTSISNLTLNCNKIQIDFTNMTNLTSLKFEYNSKETLIKLENLPNLKHLKIQQYHDKIELKNLNLEHLHIEILLDNIDIHAFPNLKRLIIEQGYNTKTFFQKLTNLTHLEFHKDYNKTTNLDCLTNLRHLNLGHNYNHAMNLLKLSNLTYLKLGNLKTKKQINMLNCSELKFLDFGRNHLFDVNLSHLKKLTELQFGDEEYENPLDLSGCKSLKKIGKYTISSFPKKDETETE